MAQVKQREFFRRKINSRPAGFKPEEVPSANTSNLSTAPLETLSIFTAARLGDLRGLERAVNSGINVDAKALGQRTPLMFAAETGKVASAKWLLEHKADPNFQDLFGNSALHLACDNGWPEFVTLLLNNGAEINQRKNSGRTPLLCAVQTKFASPAIVQQLLERKADTAATASDGDFPGRTAVDIGRLSTNSAIVRLLTLE